MQLRERIEKLQLEYTDQYVIVDADVPELARFRDAIGQVKTINYNGRALVQFDIDDNLSRYDIALDYLKVVDKPEPKPMPVPAAKKKPAPPKKVEKPKEEKPVEVELSPLELARLGKDSKPKKQDADKEKSDS